MENPLENFNFSKPCHLQGWKRKKVKGSDAANKLPGVMPHTKVVGGIKVKIKGKGVVRLGDES